MPAPSSVFHQGLTCTAVPAWSLVPSPRNYNASVIEFEGKRLMAYRSHRMDQGGRCGLVVCELDAKWHATKNTWLNLPEQIKSVMVHHEDPRLFVFKGRLHVSFTETQFHAAPRSYTCTMKYARLKKPAFPSKIGRKKVDETWQVERVFWPRYHGSNGGDGQEKNWLFFESEKRLHVVYRGEPHTVLELGSDGESVATTHTVPRGTVRWPWGEIRGGTSPVKMADGRWLTFFHSSMPYPVSPHWRRYYAGAYVFEPTPPFRIVEMSQKPILVGSAEDGHAHDPRNIDSWKPFVVFPAGAIPHKEGWHVSYGVNDYLPVIADHRELHLGDPSFTRWGPKFYRTENGSTPVRLWVQEDKPPAYIRWEPTTTPAHAGLCGGVISTSDPRIATHLQEEAAGVEEISEQEYHRIRAPR